MKIGDLEIPPHADIHGTGLASWTNANNKWRILAVHYTSDPTKRSLGWRQNASAGYTKAGWDQEYEISFKTWAGRACYQGWSSLLHIAQEPLSWTKQKYMLRGWDVGAHACVWAQRAEGTLHLYTARIVAGAFGQDENPAKYRKWEIPVSGLRIFIDACLELSTEMFRGCTEWHDYVDRSAWFSTMRHGEKPIDDFLACGLHPEPGVSQNIVNRISSVEDWLATMTNARPAFQVDKGEDLLIDGFEGGYRYDQEGTSPKPVKNGHSHPHDALQYLCGNIPAPRHGSYYSDSTEEKLVSHLDPAMHDIGPRTFEGAGGTTQRLAQESALRQWNEY